MIERLRVRIPAWAAGEFSFPELTLFADFYLVPFHSVLPQWPLKRIGHFAKSADGRLHLDTYSSLTRRSRCGLTMLSSHSVGT